MLLRVEPHGLFLWLFLDFLRVTQRAWIHHELDGMNTQFQLERKRLCRV